MCFSDLHSFGFPDFIFLSSGLTDYRLENFQINGISYFRIFELSNVLTFRLLYSHVFRFSEIRILKFSDFWIFNFSHFCISGFLDFQSVSYRIFGFSDSFSIFGFSFFGFSYFQFRIFNYSDFQISVISYFRIFRFSDNYIFVISHFRVSGFFGLPDIRIVWFLDFIVCRFWKFRILGLSHFSFSDFQIFIFSDF